MHPLDAFLSQPDAREHYSVVVRAPSELTFREACTIDLQSLFLIRAIFRLRELALRSKKIERVPRGFVDEMRSIGWGTLLERSDEHGQLLICGAACQPWMAVVVFRPIPADAFAGFAEPDQVRIAWTLETRVLGPERCRLITETRVRATDDVARRKFLRYWRWARFGILPIRWLLLPAIRRRAEAERRANRHRSGG